jgi:hypothetical protein
MKWLKIVKMEKYFIILNSDGDTRVDCVTKEVLLNRINEEYYGPREFLNNMPTESDTNYWGDSILVIKGSIVAPEAKTKITEYTID